MSFIIVYNCSLIYSTTFDYEQCDKQTMEFVHIKADMFFLKNGTTFSFTYFGISRGERHSQERKTRKKNA